MRPLEDIQIVTLTIAICSTVANGLALFIITSKKWKVVTIYSMAKISLVSADLVFALSSLLQCISEMHVLPRSIDGISIGIWLDIVQNSTTLISFANITLIATQRYRGIKCPFKYLKITKRQQLIYIFLVWICGFSLGCIGLAAYHPSLPLIYMDFTQDIAVIVTSLPLFSLTLISTAAMLHTYFKHTRSNILNSGNSVTTNRKKHGGVVKMTSLIVLCYVIFCGPWLFMSPYQLIKDVGEMAFLEAENDLDNEAVVNSTSAAVLGGVDLDTGWNDDISESIFSIVKQMFNLNGIVDVVVYGIFDKEFRSSLKALFTCKNC